MDTVFYEELTPSAFLQRIKQAPIAYLPLGTLEWHGPHLPLGSDGLQSRGLFAQLAQEAGGIVLPMLFVGPDLTRTVDGFTYIGMDFWSRPEGEPPRQLPGSAYHVASEAFSALLEAVLAQLHRAGFRIVVAHGHGPSTKAFMARAREWEEKFGLYLRCAWSEDDRIGFQTDHAAANETSIMMYFHPELVDMAALPQDPACRLEGISGEDPRYHASAGLGRDATRETVARLGRELKALCGQLK